MNALDPRLSAGGSSGGAAVALARHMLPVADGSDMMGSLRNPAGWKNVVGFPPTQGLVPYSACGRGLRPVADTAYLLSVQAGYDARAPLSLDVDPIQFRQGLSRDYKGARIGWPKEFMGKAMDTYHRWMEVVIGPTLAGVPVAAVPAGFGPKGWGQPMGLQIIGPRRAEFAVLQIAHSYEQASGFRKSRPR